MNNTTTLSGPAAYGALALIILIGVGLFALAVFATLTAKDTAQAAHIIGAVGGWLLAGAWFGALLEVTLSARFDRD